MNYKKQKQAKKINNLAHKVLRLKLLLLLRLPADTNCRPLEHFNFSFFHYGQCFLRALQEKEKSYHYKVKVSWSLVVSSALIVFT